MKRFSRFTLFVTIFVCSFGLMNAYCQQAEATKPTKASQETEATQGTKEQGNHAAAITETTKENNGSPEEMQNLVELKQSAPKVFIDCQQCDMDYIRTEIPFVNYVRDRKEADAHVMIHTQQTGSDGNEYTFSFIGLNSFSDINATLKYTSNKTDSREEVRRGYTNILKMGLMSYAARTPICNWINVSFDRKIKLNDTTDKWNYWVFSISLNGRLNGESQRKSNSLWANFSANRVTPKIKIRLGISANREASHYSYEEEEYDSLREGGNFNGLFVRSLGEHWSAGMYFNISSSTYNNIKYKISPGPAIEYNVFPYSQSTRRQLRFLYKIGFDSASYRSLTVFDKTKENLFGQSLSVTLEIKEPWGTISSSLQGSNYFHDFTKNRFEFSTEMSLRLFKGLNFNINGSYERVRDQLSLVKGDSALEDVLLRIRELSTNYEYRFSVGLSYTFGSIFSNVVNPRFGNDRRGQGFGGGGGF